MVIERIGIRWDKMVLERIRWGHVVLGGIRWDHVGLGVNRWYKRGLCRCMGWCGFRWDSVGSPSPETQSLNLRYLVG